MQSSLFTHRFTGRSRSNIAKITPSSLPPEKDSYDKLYDEEKRQRVLFLNGRMNIHGLTLKLNIAVPVNATPMIRMMAQIQICAWHVTCVSVTHNLQIPKVHFSIALPISD